MAKAFVKPSPDPVIGTILDSLSHALLPFSGKADPSILRVCTGVICHLTQSASLPLLPPSPSPPLPSPSPLPLSLTIPSA